MHTHTQKKKKKTRQPGKHQNTYITRLLLYTRHGSATHLFTLALFFLSPLSYSASSVSKSKKRRRLTPVEAKQQKKKVMETTSGNHVRNSQR